MINTLCITNSFFELTALKYCTETVLILISEIWGSPKKFCT